MTSLNFHDRPLIIDGGLGMQLIHDGHESIEKSPLWSAELVYSMPEAVESAHLKFLDAGAEILETATYQMSFEGFTKHLNLNQTEIEKHFEKAVQLARGAIKIHRSRGGYYANRPIILAGSVGAYGALLADRSEYTGAYWDSVSREKIATEHRLRISVLIRSGCDMIAAETLPSTEEADLIIDLMRSEFPNTPYYLSFATHDGISTPRGQSFVEYFANLSTGKADMSKVFGVGLNCSSIESINTLVEKLVANIHRFPSSLKFIFYPNLDEPLSFNNEAERAAFWGRTVSPWIAALGKAKISAIGGCCFVLSEDICAISKLVAPKHC